MKDTLILCVGYPFICDKGFGYRVSQVLEEMDLPENVEMLEVGECASEFDHEIDGRKKMVVVDSFETGQEAGTIVRLKKEEVPMTINGVTDLGKYHLLDTLEQIQLSGDCPDTIFIGVVPKDVETDTPQPKLTPEIEAKVQEVVEMVLEEVKR